MSRIDAGQSLARWRAGWAPPCPELTAPPVMLASRKRRKKKAKAPASQLAPRKARRKKSAGAERKDRHDRMAERADGFFSGLRNHFTEEGYTGADWGRLAILAASLLVVLYYAFSAGGFFVVKRGYGELVVLYLLVMGLIFNLWMKVGASRRELAVIGLFGGYTVWMLVSALWSLSPAESIVEFNRGVLYLAGLLVFYLFLARRRWLGWLAALFVVIVAIVAVDGLLLKVAPDVMADYFNIGDMVKQIMSATGAPEEAAKLQAVFLKMDNFQTNRLSYPLTYWNAMVLFMIMAMPLALRGATDRRQPLFIRCFCAAVQVLFVAVVFFTFSRAGYLLIFFILALYTLLSAERLRTALHAGLTGFWAALLILVTRSALPAMVASQPSIDERVSQGHKLGWLILLLVAASAAGQVIVARLETRVYLTPAAARNIGKAVIGLTVVVALAGFVAVTAPSGGPIDWFRDQLSGASARSEAVETAGERILSLQSERYDEYKVSLKTMAANPLGGTGAGTWEYDWLRERPYEIKVRDGHSWFFDSMAELGMVGFLLLAGFVAAFVYAAARDLRFFGRSRDGDLYAAVFAACAAMLLHSTIDWHWEMPVVALPFFMFTGGLLRFGSLGRARPPEKVEGTGADIMESSSAAGAWWVWALGIGCLALMGLTVLNVVTETRHDSAQERIDQARAFVAGNMTDDGAVWFRDGLDIAAGARRYGRLDARLLVQMGDANRGLGDLAAGEAEREEFYAAAERDYLQALTLQPDDYETYQHLAELYLRSNQLDKAADAVRRAKELNPLESVVTPSLEERVRTLNGV